MIFSTRINRVIDGVRRRRGQVTDTSIPVHPDLPESGWKRLKAEIDATVQTKGGPVAARRRARTIGTTYEHLSPEGRVTFLQRLGAEYGNDDTMVDEAMGQVAAASTAEERRLAEARLRDHLRPKRELLLRRFAGLDGGLPFLIQMRADLLPHRTTSPELSSLEADLRSILDGWFDVGLLRLERLTWHTPAAFLEKLIEYEAVHAIESWDDLKSRLGPGRRCYAFVHPAMPDDPLIFVEVALTKDIARDLGPLLLADRGDPENEADCDTAIFYSISNCHTGLTGVSLGDFLIKSVVEELIDEVHDLRKFATLSPIPGFRDWLLDRLAGDRPDQEVAWSGVFSGTDDDPEQIGRALEDLTALVEGPPADDSMLEQFREPLLRLAAQYIVTEREGTGLRALDPVAHFHLSNGARVEYINWMAHPSPIGWKRGLGMMVNYRYSLKDIERNHDRYLERGEVAVTDAVRKLSEHSSR